MFVRIDARENQPQALNICGDQGLQQLAACGSAGGASSTWLWRSSRNAAMAGETHLSLCQRMWVVTSSDGPAQ